MKHVKEFMSFETNEGLLDDMKSKVKKGIIRFGKSPKLRTPVEVSREGINEGKSEWRPELRMPEQVSLEEFNKKLDVFGRVPLTEEESEFFDKLYFVNRDYYQKFLDPDFDFGITNFQSPYYYGFGGPIISIGILKLDDEWYLISYDKSDSIVRYYICDEWDEVLGFLNKTPRLKI